MTKKKKVNLLSRFLDIKVSEILDFLGFLILSVLIGVISFFVVIILVLAITELGNWLVNGKWSLIRDIVIYVIFLSWGVWCAKNLGD